MKKNYSVNRAILGDFRLQGNLVSQPFLVCSC